MVGHKVTQLFGLLCRDVAITTLIRHFFLFADSITPAFTMIPPTPGPSKFKLIYYIHVWVWYRP